jgi:hypothetical protein
MAAAAVLGVLIAMAAACGGDDRKQRERAVFRHFKAKVDAGCKEVADRIFRRGPALDTAEIPRLAEPAIEDTHRLVALVDDIALPRGTARRVKPFRDDLHALDELLRTEAANVQGDTAISSRPHWRRCSATTPASAGLRCAPR